MAVDAGSVLLYQVMPSVFVIGLLCLLLQKKSPSTSDLRAPLLSGDTVEHRVDAATREAEAGFRVCSGCEFENFKRSAYCCLCGEKLPKEPASAATSGRARRNESQLETPTHARQLRTQQIRVRKRKEWTRKLDVDGNMFWYRSCLNADETAPSSSQSPGFCVTFKSPSKEDMPPKEDGVETVAPGLVKMDDSLQMVLLSSSDADPAVSPTGSVTLQSKDRMKEVVEFAAKDFPTKYAHFVVSTAALIVPAEVAFLKLSVHREYMLEESIDHVGCIKEKNIHSYMRITFLDESGVDAGGVHREWFMLLAEQLLNPTLGLFQCTNKTEQSYYLNPNSAHTIGEEHLAYNYAAGRLVGRALLEGTVWGFHLAMPLIKIILGIPVTFSDLEYLDPEAYRSMQWLLSNDGVEDIGLDFSVTEKRGDELVTVDLVLNGRNIAVTDANKREYLERKFHYMVFESVSSQLYMFLKGLYEVIPQELLMLYDAEEFDYLLCGTQEIDVEDWKAHAVVSSNLLLPKTLGWFWEVVGDMPNEYRRRLLQFTTGSSRVPLAGFAGLTSYDGRLCPFTLKGIPCSTSRYISSHACFNRLDVPAYSSKKELEKILYATLDTELYGFTTA